MTKLTPVHPGEILTKEFRAPLGISKNKLAINLGIPASRIDQIAKGRRSISADTAFRLAVYFGNTAEFPNGDQTSGASASEPIREEAMFVWHRAWRPKLCAADQAGTIEKPHRSDRKAPRRAGARRQAWEPASRRNSDASDGFSWLLVERRSIWTGRKGAERMD
jgi:addiction module HigA family antidote